MWSALALRASYAIGQMAAPATPQSAPPPFQWTAPPSCPTGAHVQTAVESHLGMPLAALPDAGWSVAAIVTQTSDGWSLALTIETQDGRHERPLHDPVDCAAISDAAALLIALALDPDAGEPPTDDLTPDDQTPDDQTPDDQTRAVLATEPADDIDVADDAAEPAAPRESTDEPEPDANDSAPLGRLRFAAGAAVGVDLGTLRGPSQTTHINVAALLRRARIEANASFGIARRFEIPATRGTATLWMWTVGVQGGPVLRAGPVEFPLLGGIEIGQLVAWPRELLDPKRQRATWAAAVVMPGVMWAPRPWIALVARIGGMVSLARPSFSVEGIGQIHSPWPAGARASIGLEGRFPGS